VKRWFPGRQLYGEDVLCAYNCGPVTLLAIFSYSANDPAACAAEKLDHCPSATFASGMLDVTEGYGSVTQPPLSWDTGTIVCGSVGRHPRPRPRAATSVLGYLSSKPPLSRCTAAYPFNGKSRTEIGTNSCELWIFCST
jgi:hypothetical protein